ncbi:MAG TPA: hypothetical protein VNM37_27215 [Candidatus Dormibacteraeota bacterium]|nr:hypothetical protein [Candidatus Dormibacteraeota bacterium]
MAELKQFDVQGARDAGYSGAEIQWHLMKELGYPPALAIQSVNTAPREKMGPPEAPRAIGMPTDTSFGGAVNQANPMPDWYQGAERRLNQPFSMGVTGGPVGSLADVAPVIPQSKTEAALLAAGALIPPAKAAAGAKAAVRAGTRMLEGAAPEVGALSRGMALTGEDVLREAAAPLLAGKEMIAFRSMQKPADALALNDQGILYTTPDEQYSKEFGPHTQRLIIAPKRTLDLTHFAADEGVSAEDMTNFLKAKGVEVSDQLAQSFRGAEDAGGELLQYFGQFGKSRLVNALKKAGYDSAKINEHVADTGKSAASTLLFDEKLARLVAK